MCALTISFHSFIIILVIVILDDDDDVDDDDDGNCGNGDQRDDAGKDNQERTGNDFGNVCFSLEGVRGMVSLFLVSLFCIIPLRGLNSRFI